MRVKILLLLIIGVGVLAGRVCRATDKKNNTVDAVKRCVDTYKKYQGYRDLKLIEGLFSERFNSELKDSFIKRCGYRCRLFGSDKWKDGYAKYVLLNNEYRNLECVNKIASGRDGKYIFVDLYKELSEGNFSKERLNFILDDGVCKVDSVELYIGDGYKWDGNLKRRRYKE